MTYNERFYLVRHGSYDATGSLDAAGREIHAPRARNELINRGLGTSAVLLSSDQPRAVETAQIIGTGLGIELALSNIINRTGNRPWYLRDLDAVIEEALNEAGVAIDGGSQELIVVTHAPMLAIARGVESKDIRYGEVLEYLRNSWNNPDAPK